MFSITSSAAVVLLIEIIAILVNVNIVYGQDCSTKHGDGYCVQLVDCPLLRDILNETARPLPSHIVELLRSYNCGFDKDMPWVCCNESPYEKFTTTITTMPIIIRGPATAAATTATPPPVTPTIASRDGEVLADITNHSNLNLLPNARCGPILTQKISSGNKTDLFEYPWMALLEYETTNGRRFLCGGSLISDRYVLSAAHCVTNLPPSNKLISVRLGEHDTSTELDCQTDFDETFCADPVQNIEIEEIISHADYDKPKFANDIAIIRLKTVANILPDSVRPICLPTSNVVQNLLPKRVSVTGWGLTEKGSTSSELLQASVPTVPIETCQRVLKTIRLSNSQICAGGETGIDACKGDSGGPLVYPANLSGPKMVQFGIVSAGINTCSSVSMSPGVYVRVAYYMKWILDNMKQ